MKNIFRLITVLLIAFTLTFTLSACNKKESTNKSANSKEGIYLMLETEGLGQVSYYVDENRKSDFNDEFPNQQLLINFEKKTKVTIDAKADDGWKFVKWVKDKKDYSKESKLDIMVSKKTELTAVFVSEEE